MLRPSGVTTLGPADVDRARDVCALDPVANVFVAARLDEGALGSVSGAFAIERRGADREADRGSGRGALRSMLWASANLVPVGADADDLARYAARVKRSRRRTSSLFGPADQVLPLWNLLSRTFGTPMSYRPDQPLMVATDEARRRSGIEPDIRVRRAQPQELDLVVPAAAAMFTEEIGYAPYVGSDAGYRAGVNRLLTQGRTFVLVEDGRLRFKADVGSLSLGVAQVQGVWMDPAWRGRGLAAGCMAQVVDLVRADLAPTVSLYVNDYNVAALRAYERAGFERVGTFATVIL